MPKAYMYILKCSDKSYYTGSTRNIESRLYQHETGKGSVYTSKRLPIELVCLEEYERIDDAYRREQQVQGWNRKKKEALIKNRYEDLPELSKSHSDKFNQNKSKNSTQTVTILALSDSSMMSLSAIVDPLRAANRLSRLPLFKWKILSLDGKAIKLTCGIKIDVDGELDIKDHGDLLVIIAGFDQDIHAQKKHLSIIRQISSQFKTICCVEAGTWVLARAGIIKHQHVTTHWEDTEKLADKYPGLDVRNERYVIDGNIWSSGGASPALDMMLHYLRTTQNKSLAIDVASVFIYDDQSAATDAQTISLGRIEQIEPRLAKAIRIMEADLEDPISTKDIATKVQLSVRMLELLSKKHLSVTPGNYYLRLRLQSARRMVLDSNLSILDIAVRSGFSSQSALTRAFTKRYGQSPIKLRNSTF